MPAGDDFSCVVNADGVTLGVFCIWAYVVGDDGLSPVVESDLS